MLNIETKVNRLKEKAHAKYMKEMAKITEIETKLREACVHKHVKEGVCKSCGKAVS